MLSKWVEAAIGHAGISQAELARQLTAELGRSIDRAAVNKMTKGTRTVAGDEMLAISRLTDFPAPDVPTVPVVGYVGAGAQAHLYSEAQGPFDDVPAPENATDKTVAVEIRGESLGSFFDQWLVFYDDVRTPVTNDLIGKLCVVGLEDGRILIKKLARPTIRQSGVFTLLSQFEPPIYDVPVRWAAKVKVMEPR